jgi:hypothetical protein
MSSRRGWRGLDGISILLQSQVQGAAIQTERVGVEIRAVAPVLQVLQRVFG